MLRGGARAVAGGACRSPLTRAPRRPQVDPVAKRIGAVNTLVRRPDGTLKGYNTDCTAALNAIETGMGASVSGKTVLVVGAGGAGRAVAFEAAHRGARVLISNRSDERAVSLAADVGAEAVPWASLQQGLVRADVLANTTSLGMQPDVDSTPVPASALRNFSLVFDAVYTPLETRLLREAKLAGATAVNGVDMFVGQAARQFELFTGKAPPMDLMRATLMESLAPAAKS
jgi:3-dehydroquinate dehydratase/shikimate dehydrogenase